MINKNDLYIDALVLKKKKKACFKCAKPLVILQM